jgi:hypothetical protein
VSGAAVSIGARREAIQGRKSTAQWHRTPQLQRLPHPWDPVSGVAVSRPVWGSSASTRAPSPARSSDSGAVPPQKVNLVSSSSASQQQGSAAAARATPPAKHT